MRFEFDWDPAKAESNLAKHGVSFEEAMAVFHDPLALSRPDEDHGANEERWVTLGQGRKGRLVLVVHTYAEIDEDRDGDPHHFGAPADEARNPAIPKNGTSP